jgi:hypothetical protein
MRRAGQIKSRVGVLRRDAQQASPEIWRFRYIGIPLVGQMMRNNAPGEPRTNRNSPAAKLREGRWKIAAVERSLASSSPMGEFRLPWGAT